MWQLDVSGQVGTHWELPFLCGGGEGIIGEVVCNGGTWRRGGRETFNQDLKGINMLKKECNIIMTGYLFM